MKKRMLAGAAAALCCAGVAMAQPANDNCTNAQALSIPSITDGTLIGATPEPGPPPTCTTSYAGSPAVWYTLVGNGNTLTVDLCSTAASFDTKMHVYCTASSTPCSTVTAFTCVAGNDDGASPCGTASPIRLSKVTFCSAVGQTYYIMVSTFGTTTPTAAFTINVSDGTPCTTAVSCTGTTLGACCNNTTQVCTVVAQASCTTGTFQGVGTACTFTSPCPGVGACCSSSGTCSIVLPTNCAGATQTFVGVGSVCLPTNACTALLGACCNNTTGACSTTTANGCSTTTSMFQGAGTVCGVNLCPGTGACCNNTTGACTLTVASSCSTTTSTFQGAGVSCTPNPCPPSGACCIGSCCSVSLQAACTGNWIAGTTCSPNPCPAPANDLCANAIPVTAGVPVAGDNCNATSTNDGPAASCQSSGGKGVWYSFASPGGLFDISTCGSNQDTVLTVFTSDDCVTFTQVSGGCDDDTCDGVNPPGSGAASFINNLDLPAGNYLIRVSSFGSSPSGNTFTLLVSTVVTGACCDTVTGLCSLAEPGACPSGTTYQGDGTVCNPNPCVQPMGACCLPNGTCQSGSGSDCASAGGLFQGDGSACNSVIDPCPGPAGACCNNTTGVCTYVAGSTACVSGNTYSGDGSVCSPNSCPQPGACCTGTTCTSVASTGCAGDFLGVGVVCDTSTCTIGACCIASTGTCIQTNATLCANQGGEYSGDGTVCSNVSVGSTLFSSGGTFPVAIPDSTPAGTTATISVPSGSGTVSGLSVSIGLTHTWVGDLIVTLTNGSTTVTLVNRPGVSGTSTFGFSSDLGGVYTFSDAASTAFVAAAATTPVAPGVYKPDSVLSAFDGAPFEGTWTLTVSDNAGGDTGTINGLDFVSVQVTPTCQFTGACCCGSSCSATLAAECAGTNQVFMGSGTVCNVAGNYTSPCCQADYNHVGGITVQDIFDFLAGYFGGNPCADINGGGISVQDIFDFLAAYFSGGC